MQLGFVIVRGRSMSPTYEGGDRLLVLHGARPRVGCAHVVRLPDGDDGPRPPAVKRITRSEPLADGAAGWWVERDNPREGVDSWLVGPVAGDAVLARVLFPHSPAMARKMRQCRTWLTGFRRGSESY